MNIYKITNQITGDFYIGKTIQPVPVRFNTHKRNAQKNTNTRFYRAIRKYGISNFVIEVVETCNCEKILDLIEQEWIEKLNPVYNIAKGGNGGNTRKYMSSEKYNSYCENLSLSRRGKSNPNYRGKSVTEYQRQKLREMNASRNQDFYKQIGNKRKELISQGTYESYNFQLFGVNFSRLVETSKKIGISSITLRRYLDGIPVKGYIVKKIELYVYASQKQSHLVDEHILQF